MHGRLPELRHRECDVLASGGLQRLRFLHVSGERRRPELRRRHSLDHRERGQRRPELHEGRRPNRERGRRRPERRPDGPPRSRAGPADESGQTVNFIVSNNNNALFSAQPAVAATGTLTYTPAANANGSATVSVQIHDNGGTTNGGVDTSAVQTFTITVNPVNDAPSFTKGADQTVNEDAGAQSVSGWATAISAGPANESGQAVNFVVSNNNAGLFSTQPAVAANGTLTYTSAANANGSATVSVLIHDNGGTANGGVDTSAAQTFTITVTAVNDAPSFTKGADQTVNEDAGAQSVSGWATAISTGPANESGQTVNFLVSNDNNGLFSAQPAVSSTGTLTYTPAANANGSATVSVQIHDNGGTANGGVDTSAAQTFTITVNAVNDAPVLDLNGGGAGIDTSATFTEGDPPVTLAPSLVLSDVDSANMSAAAITLRTQPGGTVPIDGSAEVLNGDKLGACAFQTTFSYNSVTGVLTIIGSASIASYQACLRTITYENTSQNPSTNTRTADFQVFDSSGLGNSPVPVVTITVNAVNDAPVAANDSYSTNEDTNLSTTAATGVLNNDTDVDTAHASLTAALVAGPSHAASFTLNADGSFSYTPAANYNGSDSFTYKANDGSSNSNTATVSLTVNAVNDAPVCSNVSLTTDEDTPGDVAPNCTDVDGDTLTYSIVSGASHGTASVVSGQLHYSPAANYNGSDSFTYKANDGLLDSNTATVNVTVNAVNDAPVCSNVSLTTDEDTPGDVAPNCTDVDGDSLTYSIVSGASHGTASVVSGQLHYSPAANYNGSDSFTYKANDGLLDSNTATVNVTVNAVNDAPVCSNVSLTTDEDTPGDVAPNCSDVDGDSLTYSIVSGASHGTASVVSGQLHYSPAANYNGSDSFTYKANDGLLDSNTATVNVTVNAVNDAPVVTLTGPTGHVDEGSSFHFTYTTTDPDTGETFSDTITGCPGSVTNDVIDATTGDGSFDCTFPDGPSTHTVKVTVSDGELTGSDQASVTVDNVAPTATFTASSPIDEGSSSTLSFTGASDPSAADTIAGFHYSFACDGLTASLASTYASAGTSATTTCPFADNGSYTVKGRIFDRDEGSTDYSATVVVNNVAPTVVAPADQSSNEGTSKSFDLGSFSDPGVNDNPWAVDVNWGDASADTTFDMGTQGTIDAQSHTYADGPNDYTVTVKVTDKDGDSDSKTFSVHVNNVAPTATFTASSPIDEGSSSTLSFTGASDPSAADTIAGFHYSFACDGLTASLASTYASAGTSATTTCPFADNGSYTVKGRIFDRDEGSTDYSATVVVNNVAPTVVAPARPELERGDLQVLRPRLVLRPRRERQPMGGRRELGRRLGPHHLRHGDPGHDRCPVPHLRRRPERLHGHGHRHRQGRRLRLEDLLGPREQRGPDGDLHRLLADR